MMSINLMSSCLLVSLISGGFSEIDYSNKSQETNGKLLELLSDIGKLDVPIKESTSLESDHKTINFYLVVLNNSKSDGLDLLGVNKSVNNSCLYNQDCYSIPYSVCSLGKCSCDHNYIPKNGKCVGLIDEICEEDSDCGVSGSWCQSGFCKCKDNFYSTDNSKCLRFARGPGEFCEDDKGCTNIKYSRCSGSCCECFRNYRQEENFCLGLINAECSQDQDCGIKNSRCLLNSCKCPSNFYLEDETCHQYADGLKGECQSEEGCKHIPYSSCSDGKCLCRSNYKESSGSCLGLINAACSNSRDCITSNAVCKGTCQCPDNFYFEDNNCYQFVERLYKPVESARACERLKNSVYIRGRCECLPGYYYEDNHCYQIPLDYEIPVDSAKACEFLLNAYYFSGKCYSKEKGMLCDSSEDCKAKFSECFNGKCQCKKRYIQHEGLCYGIEKAKCNVHDDCALIWHLCESGICHLKYKSDGNSTIANKPGATTSWVPYDSDFHGRETFGNRTERGMTLTLTGDLAWKNKNYKLSNVALYVTNDDVSIIFWCRVNINGELVRGKIKLPGDKFCADKDTKEILSYGNYEMAVDNGAE